MPIRSKYYETIAIYLTLNKADSIHGIPASKIVEDCDIPRRSVYRVVTEPDSGFYLSRFPTRPQGYYFDDRRRTAEVTEIVSQQVQGLEITNKSATMYKETKDLYENMTSLGRLLSKITINEKNDTEILRTNKKDNIYKKQFLLDYLNNCTTSIQFKGALVVALLAADQNRIREFKGDSK